MPTITKSIGTSGGDYSTITTWHAAVYGGATASDDAVGECYNDSAFDERFTINNSTPSSVTLRTASGQSHSGVAGTGVRNVWTNSLLDGSRCLFAVNGAIVDIEINANGRPPSLGAMLVGFGGIGSTTSASRLIVHGVDRAGFSASSLLQLSSGTAGAQQNITNSIAYGYVGVGSGTPYGIGGSVGGANNFQLLNCTCFDVKNNHATGAVKCVNIAGASVEVVKNVISCDVGGSTSGTKSCFSSGGTQSNNISSDATATGTGSITGVSASSLFVSIVPGSEDLHLKSGALAIGAGANLGTSPAGVNFDIDGYDRTLAALWDIGADQSPQGSPIPIFAASHHSINQQWRGGL